MSFPGYESSIWFVLLFIFMCSVCCFFRLLLWYFIGLWMVDVNGKPQLLERDKDTECEFFQGDFLQVKAKDWRDGDVVFCNSTCFDDTLMQRICDRARKFHQ